MKKLDDISKKNIFQVPEGYFEDLPTRIQARIPAAPETRHAGFFSLRYAVPAVVLAGIAIVAIFLNTPSSVPSESPEAMLAAVASEDLVAYLENDADLNLDDLLDSYAFSDDDLASIEDEVYHLQLEEDVLEEWIEEYEVDLNDW